MSRSCFLFFISIFIVSPKLTLGVEVPEVEAASVLQLTLQDQIINIGQGEGWSDYEMNLLREELQAGLHHAVPANLINRLQANPTLNERDRTAILNRLNALRATFPQPESVEVVGSNPPPADDNPGAGALRNDSHQIVLHSGPSSCPGIQPAHADYIDSEFGNLTLELWNIIFSFLAPEDLFNLTHALAMGTTEELFENFPVLEIDPHGAARNYTHDLLAFLLKLLTEPFDQLLPMYQNFCLPPGDPLIQTRSQVFERARLIAESYAKSLSSEKGNMPAIIKKRVRAHKRNPWSMFSGKKWETLYSQQFIIGLISRIIDLANILTNSPNDTNINLKIQTILTHIWQYHRSKLCSDHNILAIYCDLNSHFSTKNQISLNTLWSSRLWRDFVGGSSMLEQRWIMDQNGLLPVCYLLRSIIRERLAGSGTNLDWYIHILLYIHPNKHQLDTPVTREGLTLVGYAATLREHGLDDELYNAIVARFTLQPIVVGPRAQAPVEPVIINQVQLRNQAPEIQNASHFYRNTALSLFVLIMSYIAFNTYM